MSISVSGLRSNQKLTILIRIDLNFVWVSNMNLLFASSGLEVVISSTTSLTTTTSLLATLIFKVLCSFSYV